MSSRTWILLGIGVAISAASILATFVFDTPLPLFIFLPFIFVGGGWFRRRNA